LFKRGGPASWTESLTGCRCRMAATAHGVAVLPTQESRDARRRVTQPLGQAQAGLFGLGIELYGLHLPPSAEMLQELNMTFILALLPRALAEAAQFLKYRLRDACVMEAQSAEGSFKATGVVSKIVSPFRRGVTV
jgi:hypothetical protein